MLTLGSKVKKNKIFSFSSFSVWSNNILFHYQLWVVLGVKSVFFQWTLGFMYGFVVIYSYVALFCQDRWF